jgi:hypothetical protein
VIHRPLVGALAALFLLGGVASAQTAVPFQTLAEGLDGGYGSARNVVIRSQNELQQSGVAQLLPAGTQINFQAEMVFAVFMGLQSTGGYGITISGIEREQLMTILPVPGPPPAFVLDVAITERRPAPGESVTKALTSPFHVVKLARYSGQVEFRAPTQATSVSGIVDIGQDGAAYLSPHRSMSYKVSPKGIADTLRRFEGRRARVEGTVTRTGIFSSDVVVTRIVSPIKSGDLNVEISAIHDAFVLGKKVETFGPANRAMKVLGHDSTVQVDGWLFEDEDHTPTELYVEALNVRVTSPTTLVRQSGSFISFVPRNARLKVLNLSDGIQRARVQYGNRTGYVLTSRIDAEAIIPLHGPAPTTGLTGSVPGQ